MAIQGVFRTVGVLAAGAMVLLGAIGCAPEAAPEPTPTPTPVVTPPPPPEPEPEPGAGPECPTLHCVSVVLSGDLLFHPQLWNTFSIKNTKGKNFDFLPLLEGQQGYLTRSDLAICQMETPLARVGGPYSGYPIFEIPPEVADAAKAIGYDVCTTASNHSVDQGTEGLNWTLDYLDELGIPHTGTYRTEGEKDEPLIVEANGVKIAIITATFSLNGLHAQHEWQVDYGGPENPLDPDRAIAKAKAARAAGAEIVIGAQHSGTEYATSPNIQQITNAHTLIDSGEFDMVLNHHTHSVQPAELYNGKWIFYGTGNVISESAPPSRHVNNEFALIRVQFAQQDDESWTVNDVAWVAATNKQNGGYKWCSVASDAPQGVCQSKAFDADVRKRTGATLNAMGAADAGLHEWLITKEYAPGE